MDYICKICHQKIESNAHFWENHRQKISDYFYQYEPRATKTGLQVIFKNSIEEYLEKDFNDMTERNLWLKNNPELAKEYVVDLLTKRKLKKNWIFAPGQTQLRLADIPSILYFEKLFNLSFQEICKKLDFRIKFKNDLKVIQKINWEDKINIKIDSREQKELQFPNHVTTAVGKLEYGDISLLDNEKISVERKSLNDLCGTVGKGYERFQREIARAKKDRGYLVILCENSFSNFKSIEYLPQTKHVKASYSWLAKRLRDLYEEFDNFQLCFCKNRKHASKVTEFILKTGKKIKSIDLQFLIDSKIL